MQENAAQQQGLEFIHDARQKLIALIVRAVYKKPGVNFFTPRESSQQIGCLLHPTGKIIQPHVHKPTSRHIQNTQEALFIRAGKLRVDFYNSDKSYLGSEMLGAGDTVLFIGGGHGFETIENVDIIEVKQGPYVEGEDKVCFAPITADQARPLPGREGAL